MYLPFLELARSYYKVTSSMTCGVPALNCRRGIISGACYILLFRRWAEGMVLVSLIGILGLSGGLAIVLLAAGAVPPGVILLVFTVVMGIMFWILRADLKMCARLLSVAGEEQAWCWCVSACALFLDSQACAINRT
jgi:hypothetical protein